MSTVTGNLTASSPDIFPAVGRDPPRLVARKFNQAAYDVKRARATDRSSN